MAGSSITNINELHWHGLKSRSPGHRDARLTFARVNVWINMMNSVIVFGDCWNTTQLIVLTNDWSKCLAKKQQCLIFKEHHPHTEVWERYSTMITWLYSRQQQCLILKEHHPHTGVLEKYNTMITWLYSRNTRTW